MNAAQLELATRYRSSQCIDPLSQQQCAFRWAQGELWGPQVDMSWGYKRRGDLVDSARYSKSGISQIKRNLA
jgi:hypothetical protein